MAWLEGTATAISGVDTGAGIAGRRTRRATAPPATSPPTSSRAPRVCGRGVSTGRGAAGGKSAWLNPQRHASTCRGTRRRHDGQTQDRFEEVSTYVGVSGSRPGILRKSRARRVLRASLAPTVIEFAPTCVEIAPTRIVIAPI
jgi:hypothetical protein